MPQHRIITEIETIQQGLKAEDGVERGYVTLIEEQLPYWIAVEEDVASSYEKMKQSTDNPRVKMVLETIASDSKRHVLFLRGVLEIMKALASEEAFHTQLLNSIKEERL